MRVSVCVYLSTPYAEAELLRVNPLDELACAKGGIWLVGRGGWSMGAVGRWMGMFLLPRCWLSRLATSPSNMVPTLPTQGQGWGTNEDHSDHVRVGVRSASTHSNRLWLTHLALHATCERERNHRKETQKDGVK